MALGIWAILAVVISVIGFSVMVYLSFHDETHDPLLQEEDHDL